MSVEMEETLMSKHDEARRAFLVGAAVGAGAAAGAALIPDALAQTPQAQPAAATPPAHAHGAGASQGYGAWFNVDESATIQAFTERLMPARRASRARPTRAC